MEANDPFKCIDTEAGGVTSVQPATLANNSLFLSGHMEEETDVLMTPANEPILTCSLPKPRPQPELATEATPLVIKTEKSLVNVKEEGKASSRRKSKRIQLRSSTDSDEGTEYEPASKVTAPPAGVRMLPATLRAAKIEEIPQDPSRKVGSCAENPTLAAVRSPVMVDKEKDSSGKVGSCSGTPTAVVKIKKEKVTIPSGKAPLCSENPSVMEQNPVEEIGMGQEKKPQKAKAKEPAKKSEEAKAKAKEPQGEKKKKKKSRSDAASGSSTTKAMPAAAMNLLEALKLLGKPLDEKYEDMDILDICAMKGIRFDPPRWHRPGGYDRKPNAADENKT